MRGVPCNIHPPRVLGKKRSCCGRSDKAVEVEDHGNGFMFVGTSDIGQAMRLITRYVKHPERYGFAHRLWYEGRNCAVWLTDGPFQYWDGALDEMGKPLPR